MVLLNRDLVVEKYGSNLYGLIEIDLRGLHIDRIDPHTFDGLPNLVYLWLSDNEIESISPHTFHDLKNLSRLALHNNRITHLAANSFESLSNLTRLALSHNQIVSIDPKAFHGLRSLEFVSLDNNRLEQIGPSVFADLNRAQIKMASLFGNPSAFKSFARQNYSTTGRKSTLWEEEVLREANVYDFDEFLAQFLGLNAFKSY